MVQLVLLFKSERAHFHTLLFWSRTRNFNEVTNLMFNLLKLLTLMKDFKDHDSAFA